MRALCVFCGSADGKRAEYRAAATQLGSLMATKGIDLVYGGARIGLMGAVADAALAAGGKVIGVIPTDLVEKEVAHSGLTELHVVSSMHERKALMAELADGFIAMPGGFGTCEELIEVLTWAQLGLHSKPCGLLNVAGYYDPLLKFFAHSQHEGFITSVHADLLLAEKNPQELIVKMTEFKSPTTTQLFEHIRDKI